jgi:hypothetical protein
MKKFFLPIASLLTMVSLMGVAQAGVAAAKPSGQTTHAPPAVSAQQRQADLSKLGSKRLSPQQMRALGLKKVTGSELARIKQLTSHKSTARTAAAGSYYWFTWHNARVSWSDRYYSGPYYSYPWYPYYVVYDNWKTCTYSGSSCQSAYAYTYGYYLYYYGSGWYYYFGGYTTDWTGDNPSGGPYGPVRYWY